MDYLSLLEEINSKYIIENIFMYLKDQNIKYKLVSYSKKMQNLLQLNIQDYKNRSLELISYANFPNFLSLKTYSDIFILKNTFINDIQKYKVNENIFINGFSEIYFIKKYNNFKSKEVINKNILDNQLIIDIYSPFYESLSKKDIFQKLFIVRIPFELIRKKNLMNDYKQAINTLNEYNPNFGSFHFVFYDNKDLSNFQYFNTKLKNVKKLIFEKLPDYNEYFFSILFSFNNIENNLIYLELKFLGNMYYSEQYSSKKYSIEKLNDLKVLEELRLEGFYFEKYFILTINTLKYLYLCNCDNIAITEKCSSNLKIINLFRTDIKSEYSNLKLPELIKFKTSLCSQEYKDIFDFKSFTKLKYFIRVKILDFLELDNTLLEKVYICDNTYQINSKEIEIRMIKKLIKIKTLKEIKIHIRYINNDDIQLIEGENPSVEKLIIHLKHQNVIYDSIILYNLQKKFPNLKEIDIYNESDRFDKIIDIKENSDCKINTFKYAEINKSCSNIKFIVGPYEKLVDIEFGCMSNYLNFDESFPIFNNICNYTFKSLIKFKFDNPVHVDFDIKIINNIINNLGKMPNLKIFIFKARCKGIDKALYNKFIEELLILKIKNIELGINYFSDEYSENELKNIYKDFNVKNFEKVIIKKIHYQNKIYNYLFNKGDQFF